MDQPKCLNTWVKTKNNMKIYTQHSSSSSSLEDNHHDSIHDFQGGLITWPPRSYSCSFCKREFRSAQALGGHMNVHRRDRALLKQVMITTHIHDDDDHHHHGHHHVHHVINHPSTSSMHPQHYPSQVCGPRSTSRVAHHLSLSRVSPNYPSISENKKVISNTNDDFFQGKLSMGLDLAIGAYQKEDHQEKSFKFKKFKNTNNGDYNVNALFPFFEEIKGFNYLKDVDLIKANNSMEELDLELRLGDPPFKSK